MVYYSVLHMLYSHDEIPTLSFGNFSFWRGLLSPSMHNMGPLYCMSRTLSYIFVIYRHVIELFGSIWGGLSSKILYSRRILSRHVV
jgi:hypothetical protein